MAQPFQAEGSRITAPSSLLAEWKTAQWEFSWQENQAVYGFKASPLECVCPCCRLNGCRGYSSVSQSDTTANSGLQESRAPSPWFLCLQGYFMPSVLTKCRLCKALTSVLTLVLYGTHGVCLKTAYFLEHVRKHPLNCMEQKVLLQKEFQNWNYQM